LSTNFGSVALEKGPSRRQSRTGIGEEATPEERGDWGGGEGVPSPNSEARKNIKPQKQTALSVEKGTLFLANLRGVRLGATLGTKGPSTVDVSARIGKTIPRTKRMHAEGEELSGEGRGRK